MSDVRGPAGSDRRGPAGSGGGPVPEGGDRGRADAGGAGRRGRRGRSFEGPEPPTDAGPLLPHVPATSGPVSARTAVALTDVVAPVAGGVSVAAGSAPSTGVVAAALLLLAARWGRADRDAIAALPLARLAMPAVAVAVALGLTAGAGLVGAVPSAGALPLAVAAVLGLATHGVAHLARARRASRVLVIGTPEEADELRRTLEDGGVRRWRIAASTESLLGLDHALATIRPELVIHTDHLPAAAVRGALAERLRHRRLTALHRDRFCELAFGVVPLDAADEDWLLQLADPGARPAGGLGSRVLDVLVSAVLLVLVAPLLLLLAPLIAADRHGGVLFRQQRVGRHGRPFTILKLRTMRGTGADWSGPGDPRVTRIGAVLRKTHVDELPQLWNVLRGDMALVGPRPEQVAISARLAAVLPLFPYRHLVRPGITGWARVRAGYAATTEASAVKLGNDLFYLRHRSTALDVAILLETARLTLFEHQYDVQPPAANIVLGHPAGTDDASPLPGPAAAAEGAGGETAWAGRAA